VAWCRQRFREGLQRSALVRAQHVAELNHAVIEYLNRLLSHFTDRNFRDR
jgi:hypothetical protein